MSVAGVNRDVLEVRGADAATFLQGQLSADVEGLAPGGATLALLLDPTGKLTAVLRVWRVGDDEFVLDADPGAGEVVQARLQRFLLRTDATIEATEGADLVARLGPPPATGPVAPPEGTVPVVVPEGTVSVAPPEGTEVDRIRAGWPAFGAEYGGPHSGEVIPAEVGQWLIEATVSFTKGCYVGQELTARIDSRGGNVPRHLRSFVLPAGATAGPGDDIVVAGDEGAGPKGLVTSAAVDPATGATLAMGYVHRSVPDDAPLAVQPA